MAGMASAGDRLPPSKSFKDVLQGLQRCGKSCRLRWINYLRPDFKRGNFTKQEEDLIISLHETLGNKWSQIASQLPERTDNDIKNYRSSSLTKKLQSKGIKLPYRSSCCGASIEIEMNEPVFDPFPAINFQAGMGQMVENSNNFQNFRQNDFLFNTDFDHASMPSSDFYGYGSVFEVSESSSTSSNWSYNNLVSNVIGNEPLNWDSETNVESLI